MKESKRKMLWILLIVLAILLIIIGIGIAIPKKGNKENKKQAKENTATQEEIKGTYNSYSGYSFLIPEGYSYEIKEGYGIIITDQESVIYSIYTDYSNSYEVYREHYRSIYSSKANDIVTKVSKREYVALIEEENSSYGTMFVTKAGDNTSFIGMVVRSDYTPPTTDEFKVLTKILNNTKKEESNNIEDFGSEGLRMIGYKKENYTFKK